MWPLSKQTAPHNCLPGNLILYSYKLKASMLLASTVTKLTTTKAKGTNVEVCMTVYNDSVTKVAASSLQNFTRFHTSEYPFTERSCNLVIFIYVLILLLLLVPLLLLVLYIHRVLTS